MPSHKGYSRREFAKATAFTAAAVMLPSPVLEAEEKTATKTREDAPPQSPPKLAKASQSEADSAYDLLIRKYGTRFTGEQKRELKRLVYQQQSVLEKIRGFEVGNEQGPAVVFTPYRSGAGR